MLARGPDDPLSKRYYLRAVQVQVRTLLLQGDNEAARDHASNALSNIGDAGIPDQSAAAIATRLREVQTADLSVNNPMEANRAELRSACDKP